MGTLSPNAEGLLKKKITFSLTNQPIISMEQTASREANSHSASQ